MIFPVSEVITIPFSIPLSVFDVLNDISFDAIIYPLLISFEPFISILPSTITEFGITILLPLYFLSVLYTSAVTLAIDFMSYV